MKNNKIIVILLLIIIVIMAYFIIKPENATAPIVVENVKEKELIVIPARQVEGNSKDLVSFSIKPGQEVSGKVHVSGSVSGGYFFEANILINILGGNKKLLKAGHAMTKEDWMTSGPVSFATDLDFTTFPKGPAYIEIHNDNASGLPENDRSIFVPIVIK